MLNSRPVWLHKTCFKTERKKEKKGKKERQKEKKVSTSRISLISALFQSRPEVFVWNIIQIPQIPLILWA
jgi:alpha-galactosidase/6-phospho-beta-glucosidase family protein